MPPRNQDYLSIGQNAPELTVFPETGSIQNLLAMVSAQTGKDMHSAYQNVVSTLQTIQPQIETLEKVKANYIALMEATAKEFSEIDGEELNSIAEDIEQRLSSSGREVNLSRAASDLGQEIRELYEEEQKSLEKIRENIIEGRTQIKSVLEENSGLDSIIRQQQQASRQTQIQLQVQQEDPQKLFDELQGSGDINSQFMSQLMNLKPEERNTQIQNLAVQKRIQQDRENRQREIEAARIAAEAENIRRNSLSNDQMNQEVEGYVDQGRLTPNEARPFREGEQSREEFLNRYGPDLQAGHINAQLNRVPSQEEERVEDQADPTRPTTEDDPEIRREEPNLPREEPEVDREEPTASREESDTTPPRTETDPGPDRDSDRISDLIGNLNPRQDPIPGLGEDPEQPENAINMEDIHRLTDRVREDSPDYMGEPGSQPSEELLNGLREFMASREDPIERLNEFLNRSQEQDSLFGTTSEEAPVFIEELRNIFNEQSPFVESIEDLLSREDFFGSRDDLYEATSASTERGENTGSIDDLINPPGGGGDLTTTAEGEGPLDVRVVNTAQEPVPVTGGTGGGGGTGGPAAAPTGRVQDRAEEFLSRQEVSNLIAGISDVITPGGPALAGGMINTAGGILRSGTLTGKLEDKARSWASERNQRKEQERAQAAAEAEEGGGIPPGAGTAAGMAARGLAGAGGGGGAAAGGAAAAGAAGAGGGAGAVGGAAGAAGGAGAAGAAGLGLAGMAGIAGAVAIPAAAAAGGAAWYQTAQHQRNLERSFGTEQGISPGAMLDSPLLQSQVGARMGNLMLGGEEIQELTDVMAQLGSTAEQTAEALGPAADALDRYRTLTPELAATAASEGVRYGSPIGGNEARVLGRAMQENAGRGVSADTMRRQAEAGNQAAAQVGGRGGAAAGVALSGSFSGSDDPQIDKLIENLPQQGFERGMEAVTDPMGAGFIQESYSGVDVGSIDPTSETGMAEISQAPFEVVHNMVSPDMFERDSEGNIIMGEPNTTIAQPYIQMIADAHGPQFESPHQLLAYVERMREANEKHGETGGGGMRQENENQNNLQGNIRQREEDVATGAVAERARETGVTEDPDTIRYDDDGNPITEDDPNTEVDEAPQEVGQFTRIGHELGQAFDETTGLGIFAPSSATTMRTGEHGSFGGREAGALATEGLDPVFSALETAGVEAEDVQMESGGTLEEAIEAGEATADSKVKVGDQTMTVSQLSSGLADESINFDRGLMADVPIVGDIMSAFGGGDELQFAGSEESGGQKIDLTERAAEYFEISGPADPSDTGRSSGKTTEGQESAKTNAGTQPPYVGIPSRTGGGSQ